MRNFVYCLVFTGKILKLTKKSQEFGIFSLRIWYLVLKIKLAYMPQITLMWGSINSSLSSTKKQALCHTFLINH